jgi:hypothetical protein
MCVYVCTYACIYVCNVCVGVCMCVLVQEGVGFCILKSLVSVISTSHHIPKRKWNLSSLLQDGPTFG